MTLMHPLSPPTSMAIGYMSKIPRNFKWTEQRTTINDRQSTAYNDVLYFKQIVLSGWLFVL